MRIALFTPNVYEHGGVPNYVASLATAMAADNEVTIFSTGADGLDSAGIRHHKVWALGRSGFVQSITFSLTSTLLIFLSRFREWGGFDIIHTHGDYTGVEDIMTSHYCQATEMERLRLAPKKASFGQRVQRLSMNLLEKRMVKRSRVKPIIVPSEVMKQDFMRHHGGDADNTLVIYSGVDSDKYSPHNVQLYRSEVRKRHSIGDEVSVVLFVGGDWDRKGLAYTIKAFSHMNYPEALLLVLGSGDVVAYQQIARDYGVEGKVLFVGQSDKVRQYYAASDALVLPTFNEAFGLVVLEAMSSGLPVLVSSLAGASELVRNGVNGLLINDPSDALEIASKLDTMFFDKNLRMSLGKEARQTALKYTWHLVAQRHVEVYQAMLSQSSTKLSHSGRTRHVG